MGSSRRCPLPTIALEPLESRIARRNFVIGAPHSYSSGNGTGASHVVFGKVDGFAADLNLSILDGTNGFRLDGAPTFSLSGGSVSTAGDVNGDGFDDLLVGARNPVDRTGLSYVIFGKAGGFAAVFDLSTLNGSTISLSALRMRIRMVGCRGTARELLLLG